VTDYHRFRTDLGHRATTRNVSALQPARDRHQRSFGQYGGKGYEPLAETDDGEEIGAPIRCAAGNRHTKGDFGPAGSGHVEAGVGGQCSHEGNVVGR